MNWTTMTARFASKCRKCGGDIKVGDKFRYGRAPGARSGVGEHMAGVCGNVDPVAEPPANDMVAALISARRRMERYSAMGNEALFNIAKAEADALEALLQAPPTEATA